MSERHIFLVAGEPSGDRLGAALMAGLKAETGGAVRFSGVGGPLMEAEGLESLFPMSEISIMGLVEILSQYRALKRRIRETAEAVIASAPDILVTIDIPEFSLRVARDVRARGGALPISHYVAPTVWAWRPGRAAKMARDVDHVLALFPFEPPLMEAAGMACDFVGHPVVAEPVASAAEVRAFRAAHEIGDAPLCLMLPGSRRSEIARLAPGFGAALAQLTAQRPGLRAVLPVAPAVAEEVRAAVADWDVKPVLIDPSGPAGLEAKRAAFAAADVALAASGTVSLELAASGTPMVIAYDMSWLSRQIIGRMLRTDTVTLVNLVSETRAVPEFIGKDYEPGRIAAAVEGVLADPRAQDEAMRLTMERLGQGGPPPGVRAARAVLGRISR